MSDIPRVGFVFEGPTDFLILKKLVRHLLGGIDFEPISLQPILSIDHQLIDSSGGWGPVYEWCVETANDAGGQISNHTLFDSFQLLIIQVDADVAAKSYSDYENILNPPADLPCFQPCPPCSPTTDALQKVILGWIGEPQTPPQTVLCTPSKCLDTWIMVGLFPDIPAVGQADLECVNAPPKPDAVLQSQSLRRRLIRSQQKLLPKYEEFSQEFINNWDNVRVVCSEAERFTTDFLREMGPSILAQDGNAP